MKRKIGQLEKTTGHEESELSGLFWIGLSGFIVLALSVVAVSPRAYGSDAPTFQQLTELKEASEKLPERCDQEPDRGPCKALFWKYYFNKQSNTCEEFVYGGCDGVVPFETREECEESCLYRDSGPAVDDRNSSP